MTIVETMVSLAIFSLAMAILYNFYLQGIGSQRYTNEQAQAVNSLRQGTETMVRELREARYGDDGSYILVDAQDQEIIFYSDVDTDNSTEKIRYFLSGTSLMRGVSEPSGTPPSYASAIESTSIVSPYVRNGTAPIFYYYNGNYPGDTVNNPLPTPSRLTDTKMVQLRLFVNVDVNRAPDSLEVISNVQIRNLKTNL
jgi:type II secretory pathway pseudopilin PulG